MRRRLSDQVLILEAISQVRTELREGMSSLESAEVLLRLSTLYSLLDPKAVVEAISDDRNTYERKVA